MQKKVVCFFLLLFFSISFYSQTNYPQNYFSNPINIDLQLVGNFGEIRPNHLHTGFDLRTNGKEGLPVFAVADGYVSRIKISPYGYGNALYITHPNGYTSLYGHLKSFNKTISEYAKSIQYAKQLFEIDTIISPDVLPIKKSEQIALSGNSGGSGGPHLHFEIRNTKTEMPINPLCFGYKIKDEIKPTISSIAIYPIRPTSSINNVNQKIIIKSKFENGLFSVSSPETILLNGEIGFGIDCYDTESGSTNKNGVYSIELFCDENPIYFSQLETFSFDNMRYVNAQIDYAEKQKNNHDIQKCFLSKNNKLGIYKNVVDNGIVDFIDNSAHIVKFIVKDFNGNKSELKLKIFSTTNKIKNESNMKPLTDFFDCTLENKFENNDVRIIIPAYSMYDDLKFKFENVDVIRGTYSSIYKIQDTETAVQNNYSISLKSEDILEALTSKACIISIVLTSGKKTYEGGTYVNGWVTAQTKKFGCFYIGVDDKPPVLSSNYKSANDFSKTKKIAIHAKDDLSGIKKYNAEIDGHWVLTQYDAKNNLLFYVFDDKCKAGNHTFKIEVEDDKKNVSKLNFSFIK